MLTRQKQPVSIASDSLSVENAVALLLLEGPSASIIELARPLDPTEYR